MLTNEQLIEARKRAEKWLTMGGGGKDTGTYVLLLLDHIDQLATHNRVMQVALAQFSDAENWGYFACPLWLPSSDPQRLAEVALFSTSEVSTT